MMCKRSVGVPLCCRNRNRRGLFTVSNACRRSSKNWSPPQKVCSGLVVRCRAKVLRCIATRVLIRLQCRVTRAIASKAERLGRNPNCGSLHKWSWWKRFSFSVRIPKTSFPIRSIKEIGRNWLGCVHGLPGFGRKKRQAFRHSGGIYGSAQDHHRVNNWWIKAANSLGALFQIMAGR